MATELALSIEFGGGLELLFGGQKHHSISLPARYTDLQTGQEKDADIKSLIAFLRKEKLLDLSRPELFVDGETVRPGILVLINSADWELEGELEYVLQQGDEVVFISTLHGG